MEKLFVILTKKKQNRRPKHANMKNTPLMRQNGAIMYQIQVKQIADEIDSRIERLKAHRYDPIDVTGNHVEELNQAVSKVIGSALIGELESLRSFIDQTEGKETYRQ